MVDFKPKTDVRKVQLTGGATYTISLPKKWVIMHDVQPRDPIQMEWRPSGDLRISPLGEGRHLRRKVVLDMEKVPSAGLLDYLIAAYLTGAGRIHIDHPKGLTRGDKRVVRDFLRRTRGFGIVDEDDENTDLICLLDAAAMPLNATLNRMYLLVSSLIRDGASALIGGDMTLIDDHEDREREIDALRLLIDRQVGLVLDSTAIGSEMHISRRQSSEIAWMGRALERMGDHADALAMLLTDTKERPNFNEEDIPLRQLMVWQKSMKTLMINQRTQNPSEINEAMADLRLAIGTLVSHEEGLWDGNRMVVPVLFEYRLSEIVRRLCAYARDFAEAVLNLIVHLSVVDDLAQ